MRKLFLLGLVVFLSGCSINPLDIARMKARDSKRVSDLVQMQTALELFYTDNLRYPEGENLSLGTAETSCLASTGWEKEGCSPAYMYLVPTDPTMNRFYTYTLNKDKKDYVIVASLEDKVDFYNQTLRGIITMSSKGINKAATMSLGDELITACKPGAITANVIGTDYTIEYSIKGKKDGACQITWQYDPHTLRVGNPIKGKSATCLVPSSVQTIEKLNEFVTGQLENGFTACTGTMKDWFEQPAGAVSNDNQAARDAQRLSDVKQLQTALEIFYADMNRYPDGNKVMVGAKDAACLNASGWQKSGCANAYMSFVPADPISKNYYSYTVDANKNNYTVTAKLEGKFSGYEGIITLTNEGIRK